MQKRLSVEDIYRKTTLSSMDFATTTDIQPMEEDILKQDKAKEAIRFGLSVERYGYNLFVSGSPTTRKKTFLKKILKEFASKKEIPNDLVYVHNFKDEVTPILISLPHGKGKMFSELMNKFIEVLNTDLRTLFETDSYQKNREMILQSYDEVFTALYDDYNEKIEPLNYRFMQTDEGVYPAPIKDNEFIAPEEFEKLSEEEKDSYFTNKQQIDLIMIELAYKENEIEDDKQDKLHELDVRLAKKKMSSSLNKIKKQIAIHNAKVNDYVEQVREDVINNIRFFKPKEQQGGQQGFIQIVTGPQVDPSANILDRYQVNLLVDNAELEHAPIIFVDEMDPFKFLGGIDLTVHAQQVMTNFNYIYGGELAKANGGYIVVNVEDIFMYQGLWERLKSIMQTKSLSLSTRYYKNLITNTNLEPEDIPLDVKVIFVGDMHWYYLLLQHDPEFPELFKTHAVFEDEVKRSEEVEQEYVRFLARYIQTTGLKPFNKEAICSVIDFASRISENQDKLVLNYHQVYRILDESDAFARILEKEIVDQECIEKALAQQSSRLDSYIEHYNEYLEREIFLIETSGEKVGQINGLAVSNHGDYSIGRPAKITANTYRGTEGIISVERNVKMSGKIHDKGVETIRGFLGKTFAGTHSLSLVANVSFEQNYGGIDGDSATSTELYAILSDLSETPIKQGIAVTGSMNQKGEVQAVGGVLDKVEGFYSVCKAQGFTGEQGVIIPSSNVKDLMLSKEVRESVEKGEFAIYIVDHIKDGIEILTGKTYDEIIKIVEERLSKIRVEKTE